MKNFNSKLSSECVLNVLVKLLYCTNGSRCTKYNLEIKKSSGAAIKTVLSLIFDHFELISLYLLPRKMSNKFMDFSSYLNFLEKQKFH